jgi:glycosyltransferase involved in cell wall biosynthesis
MGDMAVFRNHSLPLFNICSTPLRAAFDPIYASHALGSRSFLKRIAYKVFKSLFIQVDRQAWKKYDGVIATSLEVKNRIIQGGLYHAGERMKLYHPGIDWQGIEVDPYYEPVFLVPGRIMWTKNIELAIEAFIKAELPEPWRLVIAGFLDEKSEDYLSSLKKRADGHSRIIFETSPTDHRLRELYQTASAVLFPPLNEDWGIVPLEAMAYSKPVLANESGGPKESIIHSETGWLLEPSPQAWASVLNWASGHIEQIREMGQYAREHSKKYDWSSFVNGVDNAIESWSQNKKINPLKDIKDHQASSSDCIQEVNGEYHESPNI